MPPRKRTPKKNLPPADELLAYYKDMLLIRRFEEKAGFIVGVSLILGN